MSIQHSWITQSTGQLWALNSAVDLISSEIWDNQLPYGAVLELTYDTIPNGVIAANVRDTRIYGNQLTRGSSAMKLVNNTADGQVKLSLIGTLFSGQTGPDLEIVTDGPVQGDVLCNAFSGGTNGVSVRTEHAPPTLELGLNIHSNVIEKHMPPNNPVYQKLKIGRGATSDLTLDMTGNWWGNPTGPYAPDRNATGLGDAVGTNIAFANWQVERPGCAPQLLEP